MKNKNLYIGLGVLAVAGIGFYMWKKKQGESSEKETAVASEEKANAIGRNSTLRFSPSRVAPVIAPIGTVGVGKVSRTFGGTVGGGIVYQSAPMPVGGDCFYNCDKLTCPTCPSGYYCKCPDQSTN
jgi:hypothetical protein